MTEKSSGLSYEFTTVPLPAGTAIDVGLDTHAQTPIYNLS